MDIFKTKVALLAHSKNMLNAAESADWVRFEELNGEWLDMLKTANKEYGQELRVISEALLADSKATQEAISISQKTIVEDVANIAKATASIKNYLK